MPFAVGSEFIVEDVAWGVVYPIPEAWMDCESPYTAGSLYIVEVNGMYYLCNFEYPNQQIIIQVII